MNHHMIWNGWEQGSINPLSTNRTDMYEKHQQWFENLQLSQVWRYESNNLLPRQSDEFWSV